MGNKKWEEVKHKAFCDQCKSRPDIYEQFRREGIDMACRGCFIGENTPEEILAAVRKLLSYERWTGEKIDERGFELAETIYPSECDMNGPIFAEGYRVGTNDTQNRILGEVS